MTRQSHSSPTDYFALRRSPSVVEIANGVRKAEETSGKSAEQSPQTSKDDAGSTGPPYEVHGGMLLLARAMGCKGKPLHDAVLAALLKNPHYGTNVFRVLSYLRLITVIRTHIMRAFIRRRSRYLASIGKFAGYLFLCQMSI